MARATGTTTEDRVCQSRQAFLRSELDRFVKTLITEYSPEKIIIFGSLVSGKIREWSDIDMIIIKETDIPFLDRIKEIIRLLRPKAGFDIVVYTPEEFEELGRNRRFFREEILSKGKIIYDARA